MHFTIYGRTTNMIVMASIRCVAEDSPINDTDLESGENTGLGNAGPEPQSDAAEALPKKTAQPIARILVIDDERAIIDIMRINLEMRGYSVSGCADSTQALERAREEKPDLIILDLLMPEKNGWEVLKELQEDEKTRSVPVIICSVMKQGQVMPDILERGASGYLAKPFDSIGLLQTVQQSLGRG